MGLWKFRSRTMSCVEEETGVQMAYRIQRLPVRKPSVTFLKFPFKPGGQSVNLGVQPLSGLTNKYYTNPNSSCLTVSRRSIWRKDWILFLCGEHRLYLTCVWPCIINVGEYKWPTRCNNNNFIDLWISSTCFGQSFALLQERKAVVTAMWCIVLML